MPTIRGDDALTSSTSWTPSVTDPPIRYRTNRADGGRPARDALEQLVTEQRGQRHLRQLHAGQEHPGERVDLLKSIRSTTYSGELEQLRNVDRSFGTGGLSGRRRGKSGVG